MIQNLIYPAMLGSFFVLLFQNYLLHLSNLTVLVRLDLLFYILLLFYFIISYLVNESIENNKIYNLGTFSADVFEVMIMFFAFSKLIEVHNSNDYYLIKDFYFICLLIPVTQTWWNITLGEWNKFFYIFNFIILTLLLAFGLWGYKILVLNYILLIIIFSVFVYYLIYLIRNEKQFE
ncbi:MAG: hypothetical protein K9I68_02980 [Bacteroidales bacterium]|nr:hypothetical protein [Bacteroidales bacterium]